MPEFQHMIKTLKLCQLVRVSLAIILGLVSSSGCGRRHGPELARVTGVVRLDGEPLSEAMVIFSPSDQRRESYSFTDSSGRYDLRYNSQEKGAEIGSHEVRICPIGVEPKSSRNAVEGKTRIPPHYSGKDFMVIEVNRGANSIDLDLATKPPAESQKSTGK